MARPSPSLNFAPYQSPPSSPRGSSSRLLPGSSSTSKPSTSSSNTATRPKSPWFSVGSYQSGARPSDLNSFSGNAGGSASSSSRQGSSAAQGDVLWDVENGGEVGSGRGGAYQNESNTHDAYDTTYGWRIDIEAAAAYIAGPILAIVLLILETKNDYVRFHAWQSLLLGAGLAILHILLLWSSFFSWLLFLVDAALYGHLAFQAYRSGDTLQRYHLPKIGELANQWTEEE